MEILWYLNKHMVVIIQGHFHALLKQYYCSILHSKLDTFVWADFIEYYILLTLLYIGYLGMIMIVWSFAHILTSF